ncbi:hypothetical protein AX27061_1923 [Achromobacter xylosoxidans NBRC 15126 = ATCC 27061]|nr:hypothetical protein AX27061_1923 [Achromobacter xylosoxidans NBRC 15126 = ATCC 27061]CCH07639.1 hypothetical protein NH44784_036921 [Achromobacter xylosoxidans NH44784-1996]
MFAAARANYQEFHCCVILKVASRVSSDTCPRNRPRIRAGPDPVTAGRGEGQACGAPGNGKTAWKSSVDKTAENYCASSKMTVV